AGDDVLLTIAESAVPRELGPALAAAVGELVAPYLGRCAGVLATGGETARAILAAAGGSGLLLEDEVEPGAPVGIADTSAPLRFVTKAGAFGSPDTLVKCREALRGRPRRRHGKDAMARPVVGITMGDPAGVGPEVVMKALAVPEVHAICRPVVIGDAARLRLAGRLVRSGLDVRAVESPARAGEPPHVVECVDVGRVPDDLPWGRVSAAAGEAAYRCVERAVRLALEGAIAAICTAPLNKEALHAAGHRYPGHTELLAALSGTREVSMMLATPKLRVIHVTTHMGLLDAIERIEGGLVERTIVRGHEALVRAGIARPRVAVCGLNPHAGEHGLFGRGEEETKIAPGVEAARGRGIAAEGPLPADTVFFRAGRGEFDLVVAMYHDQGHGPVKVLGIEAGVNITVGLPFVRTSVDHGTAFDIAGTGRADERSMVEAIRQAVALAPKA
ncbi:MAG TPA: 4-hydroxythreonine-4-phosphate dehydrogenase PdxA, partial [Anaeromyxobacter sp.]